MSDELWKVINDIQHRISLVENRLSKVESRISVVENDVKWVKWLLGIELPFFIGLIIGVVRLLIG